MNRWIQVVLGLFLAIPMFGQNTSVAQVPAMPILLGADLPIYPPVWRTAHLTGPVVVLVTVKEGRVVETEVKSGESHLQVPTISNLKTWRFDTRVNGQFTVTYTYQISGEPVDGPSNPKVEVLPSLDVNITARPIKPTCMDCRAPPMKVLPKKTTCV
jgi:hypothetical protein